MFFFLHVSDCLVFGGVSIVADTVTESKGATKNSNLSPGLNLERGLPGLNVGYQKIKNKTIGWI